MRKQNSCTTRGWSVILAFIKELMRRIAQFTIERGGDEQINQQDVDGALDEMLFKGGSLNLSILGASERVPAGG